MSSNAITVKKILIIATGPLKVFLYALPLINTLNKYFKDVSIHVIISPEHKKLASKYDSITEIILDLKSNSFGRNLKNLVTCKKFIAAYNFDVIIFNQLDWFYVFIGFLARIPLRIGHNYNVYLTYFLTHDVHLNQSAFTTHQADESLNLLKPLLNFWDADVDFKFHVEESVLKKIKKIVSFNKDTKYILIDVEESQFFEQWVKTNLNDLIKKVKLFDDCKFILVNSKLKFDSKEYEEDVFVEDIIVFEDKLTVEEKKALVQLVSMVIAHNTDILHIAVALKKNVLMIKSADKYTISKFNPWKTNHVIIENNDTNGFGSNNETTLINYMLSAIHFLLKNDISFPKIQELYWFKINSNVLIHISNKNKDEIRYLTKIIEILKKARYTLFDFNN